jgi:hypothetical protein
MEERIPRALAGLNNLFRQEDPGIEQFFQRSRGDAKVHFIRC